jgi:hypothetical protein
MNQSIEDSLKGDIEQLWSSIHAWAYLGQEVERELIDSIKSKFAQLREARQSSQSEPIYQSREIGRLYWNEVSEETYLYQVKLPKFIETRILYAAPQQAIPSGYALVPHRLTKAMDRVLSEDDWQWEDLLAAANAITEQEYQDISTASPTAPIERDK